MAVARITEITSSSKKSFQAAIEKGIKRATKTLKNVKSAWIADQELIVDGSDIVAYRVRLKITFLLSE